jgi:hypothetical protein
LCAEEFQQPEWSHGTTKAERERAWYENIRTALEWPQHSHYPLKKTEPAGFISLRLSKEVIKFDFFPSRSMLTKRY